MTARDVDNPAMTQTWAWTGPAASATNRFGLTCWGETDAHFLYARAFGLASRGGGGGGGELRITKVSIAGGNVTLEISNAGGAPFTVESSATLAAGSWTVVAANQTGTQWSTAIRPGPGALFYRLRR